MDMTAGGRRVLAPSGPTPPSSSSDRDPVTDGMWASITCVFAAAVTVLLGADFKILPGFSVGVLLAIASAPVWVVAAWRCRGYPALSLLSLLALTSGLLMAEMARPTHTVLLVGQMLNGGTLISVVVFVGFLLWARAILPTWLVAALYGFGLLLSIRPEGNYAVSAWRFGFATPVTIIVLAMAARSGRRGIELAVAVALSGAAALSGARSIAAILAMTFAIVLWRRGHPSRSRPAASLRVGLVLLAVGYTVYNLGQAVILEGLLGEAARNRSAMQIQQSGSLIVGGRPEMAATWALFRHSPFGFGLGVVPSYADVQVAKQGLVSIHYAPDNDYVERYMFGSSFVLHSGIGELWAWFGIAGLVLAMLILWLIASRTVQLVSSRSASALVLFVSLLALWNHLFSPMLTSGRILALCLALLLAPPIGIPRRPPPYFQDGEDTPGQHVIMTAPPGRTE